MLDKDNQNVFMSFIKNKVVDYDGKKTSNYLEKNKLSKEEELAEAKKYSKFLNSEYRRYKSFDMFAAQVLNSKKVLPVALFIGVTFVVAMYNILSALNEAFMILFGVA